MTTEQSTNFINWFRDILLKLEDFFHQIQAWFEGTIMEQDWYKNLMTETDAKTETNG